MSSTSGQSSMQKVFTLYASPSLTATAVRSTARAALLLTRSNPTVSPSSSSFCASASPESALATVFTDVTPEERSSSAAFCDDSAACCADSAPDAALRCVGSSGVDDMVMRGVGYVFARDVGRVLLHLQVEMGRMGGGESLGWVGPRSDSSISMARAFTCSAVAPTASVPLDDDAGDDEEDVMRQESKKSSPCRFTVSLMTVMRPVS